MSHVTTGQHPDREDRLQADRPPGAGSSSSATSAGSRSSRAPCCWACRPCLPVAKVLAAIDAEVHTPLEDDVRTAAADAGMSQGVQPGHRVRGPAVHGAAVRRQRDRGQLPAPRGVRVLPSHTPRPDTSGRAIVLGPPPDHAPRVKPPRNRPSRGSCARSGRRPARGVPSAGLRRPEGRVHAALLPLAEVGLRERSGRADRGERAERRWSTGSTRRRAGSRWSPAPPAGSVVPSPRFWRATART